MTASKLNTFVSKLPTCGLPLNKRKLLTSLQNMSDLSCSEPTPKKTVDIVKPTNNLAKINEKTSIVLNHTNVYTSLIKQAQLNDKVNKITKLVKSQIRRKTVHRVKLNNVHPVGSSQPTVRDDNVETRPRQKHCASNKEY